MGRSQTNHDHRCVAISPTWCRIRKSRFGQFCWHRRRCSTASTRHECGGWTCGTPAHVLLTRGTRSPVRNRQRCWVSFETIDPDVHIAVDLKGQGFRAVMALGIDPDRQVFVSQAPLHEGRCYRICCSSRIQPFTAPEAEPMGRFLYGHGIRPNNRALVVAKEKRFLCLQLVEDLDRTFEGKTEVLCHGQWW